MLETMRLTGEMRDKADDCEVWVCIREGQPLATRILKKSGQGTYFMWIKQILSGNGGNARTR